MSTDNRTYSISVVPKVRSGHGATSTVMARLPKLILGVKFANGPEVAAMTPRQPVTAAA